MKTPRIISVVAVSLGIVLAISKPASAGDDDDAWSAAHTQCKTAVPGFLKSANTMGRYLACMESSPYASSFNELMSAHIRNGQELVAQSKAGVFPWNEFLQRDQAYTAKVDAYQRQQLAQEAEDRRTQQIVNAIESVPLQNAWWGAVLMNGRSMGRGYTPHALRPLR
jgi:hypothetical protein